MTKPMTKPMTNSRDPIEGKAEYSSDPAGLEDGSSVGPFPPREKLGCLPGLTPVGAPGGWLRVALIFHAIVHVRIDGGLNPLLLLCPGLMLDSLKMLSRHGFQLVQVQ